MTNKISKIEEALNSVRPFLKTDGGDVELVNIDENNVEEYELLPTKKEATND